MNKGGFSWKRLSGYSAAKGKLSRQIGVPLSKSGRQQKVGRVVSKGCLVGLMVLLTPLVFLIWLLSNQ